MIHIAIVEDDSDYQRTLVDYIRTFLASDFAYDYRVYNDGLDYLAAEHVQTDIIFLDIVMPHSNGLDVALKIREYDQNVVIIFVTEAIQYALDGYKVRACDFLIKPLYYTSFCVSMQRALHMIRRHEKTMIKLDYNKTTSFVDRSSIYYIEAKDKHSLFHTQSGNYPCADTLKNLESKLSEYGFGRCHHGYLVNLAYVQGVRKTEVMVHDEWLPISRYKHDDFVRTLIREAGATV